MVGGELVMALAEATGAQLIPVDSEHSALHQLIRRERPGTVDRLVLTASGGPFRGRTDLESVTREEALAHPTWEMGGKITIDSATLINKGLELIEAHHLFGVRLRADRRRRPPAVDHPLAGPPQRRRLDRAHGLSRHAGADLLRAQLSRARRRRAAHSRPRRARRADLRGARPRRRSPACAWRARPARPAARRRASSTPPTRSRSPPFLAGEIGFTAIPEVIERDARGRSRRSPSSTSSSSSRSTPPPATTPRASSEER